VFLSLLPLVFRPCFGELAVIAATDSLGVAAYIGSDGLLRDDDDKGRAALRAAADVKHCAVRVKVKAL
jgi:hypothetical protein